MHQVHSALHHGHVREAQEDGVFVDRARGFFAAIDGMGGSYSGADAVTFIQKHLEETTLDANAPLPSLRGCLEAASARWWQVAQAVSWSPPRPLVKKSSRPSCAIGS